MPRPGLLFFVLVISMAATVHIVAQTNPVVQSCLDPRVDASSDLDKRIDACLRVIGDGIIGHDVRAEAYLRRALAYAQKYGLTNSVQDADRAIADLSDGLRLDPKNAAGQRYALQMRAGLYYHKGDYDRALADYTALLGIEPNSTTFYVYRAEVFADKGDRQRAIADLTQAIQREPKAGDLYAQRALLYVQINKLKPRPWQMLIMS